ncbi:MAG: GNAT family N-acetyltransferase [Myxococcales bacterium]|nr:GNAT family N-acetyltransferase [Myxococcales bacterium]MCB9706277.1 GNAT family N-acetyltransferase [Myxococcales bacterium]
MSLKWIRESPPEWDAEKARIIGAAPPGTFGADKLSRFGVGELIPGDWWRVEREGKTVGYGWMDTTWGDAEILLAVDPEQRRQGVGTFILRHLEDEARGQGFNYLYNVVSRQHPDADGITEWLGKRDFVSFADGSLRRSVVPPRPESAS